MKNNVRAFICIDLPDEVIKEVARIHPLIKKQKFAGKLTELENLHLTLKFLGEISSRELEKVKDKLEKIEFPHLSLKLSHIGTFSYKNNPRIVWIKVTGNINQLQKSIDDALSEYFPKEKRFMSHLTIARIKHTPSPVDFKKYISQIKIRKLNFKVNSFKLKESELKPLGPIYTTIKEYSFI